METINVKPGVNVLNSDGLTLISNETLKQQMNASHSTVHKINTSIFMLPKLNLCSTQ